MSENENVKDGQFFLSGKWIWVILVGLIGVTSIILGIVALAKPVVGGISIFQLDASTSDTSSNVKLAKNLGITGGFLGIIFGLLSVSYAIWRSLHLKNDSWSSLGSKEVSIVTIIAGIAIVFGVIGVIENGDLGNIQWWMNLVAKHFSK